MAAPTQRAGAGLKVDESAPLLLDGPTGTELIRRGYAPDEGLWTAAAAERDPALLFDVHRSWVCAGARVLTANTFRTTAHAAARAGRSAEEARRLLRASVAIARAAAREVKGGGLVAGSLAPLGDCYRPEETPGAAELAAAHGETAAQLAAAGCDLILCETLGTEREALAALRAARATGLPAWVSLLPAPEGDRLLGGDPLLPAARRLAFEGAAAVLVNCADAEVLGTALTRLLPALQAIVPVGAYPNAARMARSPQGPVWSADERPEAARAEGFAAQARAWAEAGAAILGACCGATPPYLAALRAALGG